MLAHSLLSISQGHSYDWCINTRTRTICISITPLSAAHHHNDLMHMAAGAAALYISKYAALGELYSLAACEVQLVPRRAGLAGCLEYGGLSVADKNTLRTGFLSSLFSLFSILSLQADWLGDVWVSVQ